MKNKFYEKLTCQYTHTRARARARTNTHTRTHARTHAYLRKQNVKQTRHWPYPINKNGKSFEKEKFYILLIIWIERLYLLQVCVSHSIQKDQKEDLI